MSQSDQKLSPRSLSSLYSWIVRKSNISFKTTCCFGRKTMVSWSVGLARKRSIYSELQHEGNQPAVSLLENTWHKCALIIQSFTNTQNTALFLFMAWLWDKTTTKCTWLEGTFRKDSIFKLMMKERPNYRPVLTLSNLRPTENKLLALHSPACKFQRRENTHTLYLHVLQVGVRLISDTDGLA